LNKRKTIYLILFALFSLFSFIGESAKAKTYALIISGISKDPQDKISRARITAGFQAYLLNNTDVTSDTLKVLTPDKINNNTNISQYTNVQKVMSDFNSKIKSEDRFILFYTGQANVINKQLRFNLPGEDITQVEFANLFKNNKAGSMLIVLDCPAGGLAVKELSKEGRIIICSCTEEQRFNIKFSECFVSSLSDSETDIDNDGKKSILEIFIATSKKIEDWYRKEKLLLNETPILDDNGDGKPSKEPWQYIIDLKDGLESSKYFLEKE